ncbi:MAG: fimbrial biogenesis outer membrane usher protein [Sphingomonadales bacterium]|nr:fimbrial biogenesis outer membrane usher protein [Sphingomonadales bacterium]
MAEYSFELGFPRLGGTSTLGRYLDFVAGSGTVRYGLNDRFTIEGHAEAGGGLVNGGVGFAAALGFLGSLNGSISASKFRGKDGGRATVDYQVGLNNISAFASIVREFGNYNSLGDATAIRGLSVSPGNFQLPRQRESIDRAGVFFRLPFDPTTIDLAYNRLDLGAGKTRTVSAGFTRRINGRLSVNGTMLLDLERSNTVSARINFNLRLGSFATATIGGDHVPDRNTYSATVNGFNAGRQNQLGYSLSQRGDDEGNASRSARLDYRLPEVLLSAALDQSKGDVRGQLAAEGAILFADKRLFPANRIGESFALIKNAGPGAEILQNGRRIARSDKKGNALLAELEAFDETRISLDPTKLPIDFEARNGTEFEILTSRRNGAIVDFGVRKVFAGIVVIVDKDGKPYPPGTQVLRDGFEPDIMGYDGEVFLRDLKPMNEIKIDRGEGGMCSASFAYSEGDAEQPRIGPVRCQ